MTRGTSRQLGRSGASRLCEADKRYNRSVRPPVGQAAGAPLNEEPCCVRPA
jgi:hypothetical protein